MRAAIPLRGAPPELLGRREPGAVEIGGDHQAFETVRQGRGGVPDGEDSGWRPGRVNAIVKGKRAITADTALRPGRFFGTTAQFWANLQSSYDLECAAGNLELSTIDHTPHD